MILYANRYGEVVPLGPNYLPSYAAGVRCGIKELGPKLLGQNPTQIRVINAFMDYHLKGHPYVKSPIDMACWDILGKVKPFFSFLNFLLILFVFNYFQPRQLCSTFIQYTFLKEL